MPTRGFFNSFQILLKVLHLIVVTQNDKFYRNMLFECSFFLYKQKLFFTISKTCCISSTMFEFPHVFVFVFSLHLLENCLVRQTSFLKSYFSIHMSCFLVYKSMAVFFVSAGIVRTVSI